jgi:hypothetical protein
MRVPQQRSKVSEEFSDHQWQRLAEAGPQIALAVAASAGSAKQSVAELDAFLRYVDETADDSDGHGIVARLAADTRSKVASGMLIGSTEDAIPDGIHAAREAGAILGVHGDEEVARALRQWLLRIADTVAHASREGGVLGIGGQEVSTLERETMASIADGLGSTYDPNAEPDTDAQPVADAAAESQAEAESDRSDAPVQPPAEAEPGVGPDGQPIGPDNIREGRVRGTMGGPNQQQGEGQGG